MVDTENYSTFQLYANVISYELNKMVHIALKGLFFFCGKKRQIIPLSPNCTELILLALWPQLTQFIKAALFHFYHHISENDSVEWCPPRLGASNI